LGLSLNFLHILVPLCLSYTPMLKYLDHVL